jgi:lipoprotein-releasing system permease protein
VRYELTIGLRYLRARRRERFVSLIALISLAGVALGTFALTVTLSVMSGLERDLRQRLLAFVPHVTVEARKSAAAESDKLKPRLSQIPAVTAVAPFISSQVMVVSNTPEGVPGYVSGAIIKAVPAGYASRLPELKRTLVEGDLGALGRSFTITSADHGIRTTVELPGAIVGRTLALELGLKLGDPLVVITPASFGGLGAAPRLKRFVVGGVFRSGMYQYDSALVFVPLKQGEALLAGDPLSDRGFEVRVRNLFDAPAVAKRISATAGPKFRVRDWTRADAPLFAALKLEKLTYFVILLLFVLVASFNIVATLVMVVIERRKEVAVLRTMGARAISVAAIFVCEAAVLGVTGTAAGVGSGLLASFLVGHYRLIRLPPDVFMVSALPARLSAGNFVAVAAASILLCIAAAIYPALRARSLSPVEVIRYE